MGAARCHRGIRMPGHPGHSRQRRTPASAWLATACRRSCRRTSSIPAALLARGCRSSTPRVRGLAGFLRRQEAFGPPLPLAPNALARVSVLGAVSPDLGLLHGARQDRSRAVRRGRRRVERTEPLPDLVARDRIDEALLEARRDPVPRLDAVHLQGLRFPSLAIEDEHFLGGGIEQDLSGASGSPPS